MNNLTPYRQNFGEGRTGKVTFGPLKYRYQTPTPALADGETAKGNSVEVDFDKGRGFVVEVFEIEFRGMTFSNGERHTSVGRSFTIGRGDRRGNGIEILIEPAARRNDKRLTVLAEALDAIVPDIARMYGAYATTKEIGDLIGTTLNMPVLSGVV